MFHNLFNFLVKSRYFTLSSFSFNFTLWSAGRAKFPICQVLFFLLIILRFGRLADIRWSVFISKSQRSLGVSFSKLDSGSCIYHLFVRSNYYYYYYYLLSYLADSLSLESEWQQVSRTPLSVMAYTRQLCSLDSLLLFSNFPVSVPLIWWLNRAHQLKLVSPSLSYFNDFLFSSKVYVLIRLFAFLKFYPVVSRNGEVHYSAGFFFVLDYH